jgi:pimeloyl-ACP methyl ester carboxylesterase
VEPVQPFRVSVPAEDLDDLALRLERRRRPSPQILGGGETTAVVERIEELLDHWGTRYDWRAQERRVNALPHHRATVGGVPIHFIEVRGTGHAPLPLLLTNGWPSSFVEYLGVLGPLTDPAAHGGDPDDAFTVVVPALPGYGFSGRCLDRPVGRVWIAGLFDRLMTEHLGHRHYVAHGDDIGGGVVNRLGMRHGATVRAVQTTNWLGPADTARPTPEERAYRAAESEWERARGAYAHAQATRPYTLAYGLDDSPAGLAAWILEKFLTWSDPATVDRLSADDLLTNVMVYWATRTIGSSFRLYSADAGPRRPGDVVTVPASVLLTREPGIPEPHESWLRRVYPGLTRLTSAEEGGHFLAMESPRVFTEEVRNAFRPFRP